MLFEQKNIRDQLKIIGFALPLDQSCIHSSSKQQNISDCLKNFRQKHLVKNSKNDSLKKSPEL